VTRLITVYACVNYSCMHVWITHACFTQWYGNYFAFVTTKLNLQSGEEVELTW
jgi:hypothetical protein